MRIAVCDDNKADRQKLIEALRSAVGNVSVNEFEDGNELLCSHAHLPYDLIFLDILMPRISGMDTAERLRKTDTHTPIVFVSSSEEFGVQSYRVLAFDYLLKPVDPKELKRCMTRLCDQLHHLPRRDPKAGGQAGRPAENIVERRGGVQAHQPAH